jgi:hypothetical protein
MTFSRIFLATFIGVLSTESAWAERPWTTRDDDEPISFQLGRYETSSDCGPPCADFIFGRGKIVGNADKAFEDAVKRTGGKALPVILRSPGGNVSAAIKLGEAFARLRTTVIVGEVHCAPDHRCSKDDVSAYRLVNFQTICASGCALAIVGAGKRIIPDGSMIGVHMPGFSGHDPKTGSTEGLWRGVWINRITEFHIKHGIKREFLAWIRLTPHKQMTWLTRGELKRFGFIDDSDNAIPSGKVSP